MKIRASILLLFLATTISFSQEKNDQDFTRVYHNMNNISLSNSDGTRASININGNSIRLANLDGTHSIIDFFGDTSTLFASDGTQSTISHNGATSTVRNGDGTQFIINHKQNSSSCWTEYGTHIVNHNFGNVKERRHVDKIDVLIHKNWLAQKKVAEAQLSETEDVPEAIE